MNRIFFVIGAMFAFLGVTAGAFGAHVLKSHVSAEMLSVFETGVRYQMYHALALIMIAASAKIIGVILSDILYVLLDPRIDYS